MNIQQLLEFEEGYRAEAYYCSEGYPTIGIGTKIGPKGSSLRHYDFKVSKSLAYAWLMDELVSIEAELSKLDWFCAITGDKRTVLISMAYQLGVSGLLKFKNMIAAIKADDWDLAALEAIDSRWYNQTTQRAVRHAKILSGQSLEDVYKL